MVSRVVQYRKVLFRLSDFISEIAHKTIADLAASQVSQ